MAAVTSAAFCFRDPAPKKLETLNACWEATKRTNPETKRNNTLEKNALPMHRRYPTWYLYRKKPRSENRTTTPSLRV